MNQFESMTGFGEAQTNLNLPQMQGMTLTTRIRSVNSRYLDIKVKLPRVDNSLIIEQLVRKKMSEHFKRGSIEVSISLSNQTDLSANSKISVQPLLFKEYLNALNHLRSVADKEFPNLVQPSLTFDGITKLPGIFNDQEPSVAADEVTLNLFSNECLKCLELALTKTKEVRIAEGQRLRTHLSEVLDVIKDHSDKISELIPTEKTNLENKLKEKIEKTLELFKQTDSLVKPEFQNRLKEEAAFYLDRKDVEEEIVRLSHHIEQFNAYLYKSSSSGKQLEFTLQEMFREINTLGNKIQSTAISHHVIEMKSALEKLKEQVANVE